LVLPSFPEIRFFFERYWIDKSRTQALNRVIRLNRKHKSVAVLDGEPLNQMRQLW